MANFPEIKTGTIFSAGCSKSLWRIFCRGHVFDQFGDVAG